MGGHRRSQLAAALFALAALLAHAPAARGQQCDPSTVAPTRAADASRGTPAPLGWEGEYLEIQVCYPSRQSRAELAGYLFAPVDIAARGDALPVVVIGPGSATGRAYNYLWAARDLASHGYLAIVGDPQGVGSSEVFGDLSTCGIQGCPGVPYQQTFNYVDGLQSATDFVFARAHPWLAKADLSHVGLSGHSLSARAASYIQGIDPRIGAVVAWDNLTSDLYGDAGISSGGGACGSIIGGELPSSLAVTARVPSMGQASDAPGGCTPGNTDPDVKKTAYSYWRSAGVPAMQLVFAGTRHGAWGQTEGSTPELLQLFQHYTRAWFDLYLKGDAAARHRLVAGDALGLTPAQQFSSTFRSAFFLPDAGLECDDLVAGLCDRLPVGAPAPIADAPDTGRFGIGALPASVLMLLAALAGLRCGRLRNAGRTT